eukprot:CAMPEP_0181343100 /NCGR_PEP_ID=MMETSP1101-20121128/31399_1 /TAXON_ID=46948 /ORGANISM="Rhodomonas abbreviata, Strain Caron Lab Isolate" /LENGTH=490 /DNA_ID=CAMNT_0023454693 /DNA_START=148 /DNA_END=1617 /DNA_ORIENTATION=+
MSVKAWGCTDFGALGMGTDSDESLLPREVTQTLESRNIVGITAGDSHSIAWDDRGNVYSWGRNKEGQLGHGSRDPIRVTTPQLVQGLRHECIVQAAAGPSHTLLVSKSGKLYACGAHHERVESNGAITFFGRGGEMPEHKRRMIMKSHMSYFNAEHMAPLEVDPRINAVDDDAEEAGGGGGGGEGGPRRRVRELVAQAHAAGAGQRQEFQMGAEDHSSSDFRRVIRSSPWRVPLPSPHPVIAVAVGHSFSAVVTAAGELMTWGYNDKGQLGHGHRHTTDVPTVVQGLPPIASVSCGEQHCLAVARDGSVWACGLGVFGQLGLGDRVDRLFFAPIPHLSLDTPPPGGSTPTVASVACGLYHSVLLTEGGEVLVCGHREYGQQGEATDQGETEDGMGRAQSVVIPRQLSMQAALFPATGNTEPAVQVAETQAQPGRGASESDSLEGGAERGDEAEARDASELESASGPGVTNVKAKWIASGALHSMAVMEDG